MNNPLDSEIINTITLQCNLDVASLFAAPSAIREAINKTFGPDDTEFNVEQYILAPKKMDLIGFWRESERLSLDVPVEFRLDDQRIKFRLSLAVLAQSADISKSGKAVGVRSFIFLPPGTKISLKFPSINSTEEAQAQVVRCAMEKKGQYFVGAKFTMISKDLLKGILNQVISD
jgi:hypothetical protein